MTRRVNVSLLVECDVDGSASCLEVGTALANLLPLPDLRVQGSSVRPLRMQFRMADEDGLEVVALPLDTEPQDIYGGDAA